MDHPEHNILPKAIQELSARRTDLSKEDMALQERDSELGKEKDLLNEEQELLTDREKKLHLHKAALFTQQATITDEKTHTENEALYALYVADMERLQKSKKRLSMQVEEHRIKVEQLLADDKLFEEKIAAYNNDYEKYHTAIDSEHWKSHDREKEKKSLDAEKEGIISLQNHLALKMAELEEQEKSFNAENTALEQKDIQLAEQYEQYNTYLDTMKGDMREQYEESEGNKILAAFKALREESEAVSLKKSSLKNAKIYCDSLAQSVAAKEKLYNAHELLFNKKDAGNA